MISGANAQEVPSVEELLEAVENGDPYPIPDTIFTIRDIKEKLHESCVQDAGCLSRIAENTHGRFGLIPPYDEETAPTTAEIYQAALEE